MGIDINIENSLLFIRLGKYDGDKIWKECFVLRSFML